MENSKIQWTTNTWNPWIGCSKVASGCKFCYAERDMDSRYKRAKWGPQGTRSKTNTWNDPIRWEHQFTDEPIRVFCASLCDIFEEWQGPIEDSSANRLYYSEAIKDKYNRHIHFERPLLSAASHDKVHPTTMDILREDLFKTIDYCSNLTWQLLTKRPENVPCMWKGEKRENCWLGTSVSDFPTAEEWIPRLMNLHGRYASKLFVSVEPLIGEIPNFGDYLKYGKIDWVIIGGESGSDRNLDISWIDDIVEACKKYNVPAFVKQLGKRPTAGITDFGELIQLTLKDNKGGDWEEWPQQFRIREFPG